MEKDSVVSPVTGRADKIIYWRRTSSQSKEPHRMHTKIQPMIRGIARDILAETREQGFNILVLGRRGTSAISEFNLGSRASKILSSAPDCTLILVS